MLLNEVLELAKNIRQKYLIETYKSEEIKNIFDCLSNSTLMLKPVDLRYEWDRSGADAWDVAYEFTHHPNLTQEIVDDPVQRQKLLNVKYIQYSNLKQITNYILQRIKERTGDSIGLSEIKTGDFERITTDQARKKPYKERLQFWYDYYTNNIKAIVKNNSIACIFEYCKDYYDVNFDYKGPTDMSIFKSFDDVKNSGWLDKAYKKIKNIKIHATDKSIRNYLNTTGISIKKLEEKGVFYVYVVNEEASKNIDYNKIYKEREEYKQFLNSQIHMAENNIKRYKEKLKLIKAEGSAFIVKKFIDEMYDTIFDIIEQVQNIQNHCFNNIDNYILEKSHYWLSHYSTISLQLYNNIDNYFYNELKEYFNDRFYKEYPTKFNRGGHFDYYIDTISDCFLPINSFINYALTKSESVQKLLTELDNANDKNKSRLIDSINTQLEYIKSDVLSVNWHVLQNIFLIFRDFNETNKIENLIKKFRHITPVKLT